MRFDFDKEDKDGTGDKKVAEVYPSPVMSLPARRGEEGNADAV